MAINEFPVAIAGLEVRELLGSGGMGAVYKAYQATLDRIVALKTVQPRFLTPQGLQLFQREARLLAKCHHPQIVRILEFHPEHAVPHFLMEYVDGLPLDQALKGRPWAEKARLFREVVATVASAHDHGVIHGDLKPNNILVDRRAQPHVLDFGLARLERGEAADPGQCGGTLAYLAPEVVTGAATNFLTDIYALGVTLYRLLTDQLPYQTLDEVRRGRARLPTEVNADIPEPLQRICLKAMERQSEHRYQTVAQMQRDLERFEAGRPIFVRPTRYLEELAGRVGSHLTEIQQWQSEGLINQRERDGLVRSYQGVQTHDSPWLSELRAVLTGPLLLRVGSWCLLLSSLLWPVFYWDRLGPLARVASTGLPLALMAVLAAVYLVRRQRRYVLTCLSSSVLFFLVFQITLLAEFRWLEYRQDPAWELWGERAGQAHDPAASPRLHAQHPRPEAAPSRRFPRTRQAPAGEPAQHVWNNKSEFVLSNSQLFCAALSTTACIALLLYALRAAFFAPWLAVACLLLYTTGLLLVGAKERLLQERVAELSLQYLGFAPLLYLLGYLLERWTAPRLATPFYVVATGTGLAAAGALAYHGTQEWFHTPWAIDEEIWNCWLMAYSGPFFLWAWQTERRGTEGQRLLTWWLYLLVPLLILFPLQMLFAKGITLFTLGDQPLHLAAGFFLVACAALLVLGRALHLEIFLVAAMWGLAIWVFRMAFRHFWDELSWPLVVGLTGGLLIGLGVWHARRNEGPPTRRRQDPPPANGGAAPSAANQAETVTQPQ